jgi:pimeloyl-ACP methyl ester carboxylesterase
MTTTNERETTILTMADGRDVAIDSVGPEDGRPVVFLHSAPGSRVLDPDPAATAAAGVRLITIDRPGYGLSSPWPTDVVPTVAAIAAEVVAVLELLGVERAAMIGWSGGGRVAAAVAAHRPELLTRLVVVATPAPDDQVPWVPEEHREMSAAMRREPDAAVATMTGALSAMVTDPADVSLVSAGPADDAVLEDADRRAALEAMMRESFRDGVHGLAVDIVSDQVAPWGFEVGDVSVPLTAFYGDADPIVSTEHGRWYADTVADGELRVVAGAGHLVVMTAWREILAAAMLDG